MFASYYRVRLYGDLFGEFNNTQYIYKEIRGMLSIGVVSCRVMPCRVVSGRGGVKSRCVMSCRVMSCHVKKERTSKTITHIFTGTIISDITERLKAQFHKQFGCEVVVLPNTNRYETKKRIWNNDNGRKATIRAQQLRPLTFP